MLPRSRRAYLRGKAKPRPRQSSIASAQRVFACSRRLRGLLYFRPTVEWWRRYALLRLEAPIVVGTYTGTATMRLS